VPAARTRAVRGYSLHIGIDDYAPLTRLSKAVKDATDLATAFSEMGFEATLLQNPRTKGEILAAVRRVAGRAEATQSVIVTFSGHGWGESLPGPGGTNETHDFLCPATYANPGDGVGTREVRDILNNSDALGAALIVDACRSGAALTTLTATRSFRELRNTEPGKVLMFFGTQPGMVSLEDPITDQYGVTLTNGRFTHFILTAMRKRGSLDADGDGIFTFEEMADAVARDMMNLSLLDKSRFQTAFWDSQLARVSIPLDAIDAGQAAQSPLVPGTVAHQVRGIVEGAPGRIGPTLVAEFAAGQRLASDADLRRQVFDALAVEIARAQSACVRATAPEQRRTAMERLLALVRGTLDIETGSERALDGLAAGATHREMIAQIDARLTILESVGGLRGADRPLSAAILSNLAGGYARWLVDIGDEQTLARLLLPERRSPWPDAVGALREGLPRLWRAGRPETAERLYQRFATADPLTPAPPSLLIAGLRRDLEQAQCDRAAATLSLVLHPDSPYLPDEQGEIVEVVVAWTRSRVGGTNTLTTSDLSCLRALASAGGPEVHGLIVSSLRSRLDQSLSSLGGASEAMIALDAAESLHALEPAIMPIAPDAAASIAQALVRQWPVRPGEGEIRAVRRLSMLSGVSASLLVDPIYDAALVAALQPLFERGPRPALDSANAWTDAATSLGLAVDRASRPATTVLRDRLVSLAPVARSRSEATQVIELAGALRQRAPGDPVLAGIPARELSGTMMKEWASAPAATDIAAVAALAEVTGLPAAALVEPHFESLASSAISAAGSPIAALKTGAAWANAATSLGVDDGMAWAPLMDRAAGLTEAVAGDLGDAGSTKRRDALAALSPVLARMASLRAVVTDALLARGRSLVDQNAIAPAIAEFNAAVALGADPAAAEALLIPATVTQGIGESGEGLTRAAEHLVRLADAGWTSPGTEAMLATVLRGSVTRGDAHPINVLMSARSTCKSTCTAVGILARELIDNPTNDDAYVRLHSAWDLRHLYADTARQQGVTFPVDGPALVAALTNLTPTRDEDFHRHSELLQRAESENLIPRARSHEAWRSLLADTPESSGYLNHVVSAYLERRPPDQFPCDVAAKVVTTLLTASSGWPQAVAWHDRCATMQLPPEATLRMDRLLSLRDTVRSWKDRPLAVAFLTQDGNQIKPTRVDLMLDSLTGLDFTLTPLRTRWPQPRGGGWTARCAVAGRIDPEGILLNFCGEEIRVGLDHGDRAYADSDFYKTLADGWSIQGFHTHSRRVLVAVPPEGGMLLSTFARVTGQWSQNRSEEAGTLWHKPEYRIMGGDMSFDVLAACDPQFPPIGVGPQAANRSLRLRGAMVLTDQQRENLRENARRGSRNPTSASVEIRADGQVIQTLTVTPDRHLAIVDALIPRGTLNLTFAAVGDGPNRSFLFFTDLRLLGLE